MEKGLLSADNFNKRNMFTVLIPKVQISVLLFVLVSNGGQFCLIW